MNLSATQEDNFAKVSMNFQAKAAAVPIMQEKRYLMSKIGKVQTGFWAQRRRRGNVLLLKVRHQPAATGIPDRGDQILTKTPLSSSPASPASHQVLAETKNSLRTHPQWSRTELAQRRAGNDPGGNFQLQQEVWRDLRKIVSNQKGQNRRPQCHLCKSKPFFWFSCNQTDMAEEKGWKTCCTAWVTFNEKSINTALPTDSFQCAKTSSSSWPLPSPTNWHPSNRPSPQLKLPVPATGSPSKWPPPMESSKNWRTSSRASSETGGSTWHSSEEMEYSKNLGVTS